MNDYTPTKEELHEAVINDRKISAIKMHRERTGSSLKDAKEAIEAGMILYSQKLRKEEEQNQEKRNTDIRLFLDRVMNEVEILEHLNAGVLRMSVLERNDLINMQDNRLICRHNINNLIHGLLGWLND